LVQNRDNVYEWNGANIIKIQLSVLVYYKADTIIISSNLICSRYDIADQFFHLTSYCVLGGEAANTNIISCGLTRLRLEHTIYRIRDKRPNHYTIAVDNFKLDLVFEMYIFFDIRILITPSVSSNSS
jgi:hypothetical protein